ncbi:MAG TPA: DegT/DnrJ/EryC1/StrS family aminotransferase [Candidatus Syntrophosphaera sp.]|nr:DegT/DnrJ/EryC1/StrS family aminotransferase [Candidatus Cloacimonadota bacterium]HOR02716.1 DegT/DnrJ/EryC1/StrS family aminotransferase [Candidatus Syntrophosphaera sp.]
MISVFGCKTGQEEIDLVTQVIKSQWLGLGKQVEEFENKFAQYRQIDNFVMVDSGSNALYMAIKLLDLAPGAEVVMPSLTWVSCAQAVLLSGNVPVFADVEIDTNNINAELIKPHITPKTGAVMVVHFAGKPVDMDPVLDLGYPVIEDAAHAVSSTYKGKACGTMGDVGVFSFDAVKNLTAGEGGGVAMRDSGMLTYAKQLRYCGIGKSGFEAASDGAQGKKRWWEYNIHEPFIKMLPNNITAAIALAQLGKIDILQGVREKFFARYQKELQGVGDLALPPNPETWETHSYFTYVIRTSRRDELAHYLLDRGIYTTLRYHPLHMNKIYNSQVVLPNCELLNETALSLPLHPNLSDADMDMIISSIKEFYHE